VRDLMLANALHRRGFKVVVYWMMEINADLADPGIEQRILCHGTRYHFARPSALLDRVLGRLLFLLPKRVRVRSVQGRSGYVDRLLGNLVNSLYGSSEGDPALARRLRDLLAGDQITHLMMSFASIGPLALQAKQMGGHDFDYLLTFQGDEEFAAHARRLGVFERFRILVAESLRASPWPAIVVSADYANRIVDEIEVARADIAVVYNGVEQAVPGIQHSFAALQAVFPGLSPHFPIVVYVGRQDVEKGVDLLLYAMRMLARRNVRAQLVVCGSTAKGIGYRKVLTDLAGHLGLPVFQAGSVSREVRDALFAHSHCVVYPSVNREPFGMVVAEAMAQGAPVLVPDYGGVAEVVRAGDRIGGLTFKAWDSGDLADQLERLLLDRQLHRQLARQTRNVAARFSVDNMAADVLGHVGITYPQPGRAGAHSAATAATV